MAQPPEEVHIAPPAPRQPARQQDVRRLGAPGDAPSLPAAVLDLPASLEYAAGCQRSHSRVLAAAVRQPFGVHSVARELPGGGVALQCTLASNLAVPAHLSRLALEPQPGFRLASALLDGLGALPCVLPPGASLAAAFLLAPDAAAAGDSLLPAKLQPSELVLEYSFDSRAQCSVGAALLAAAVHPGGGSPRAAGAPPPGFELTPAAEVMELLGASGGSRPATPDAAGGGRDSPTATAGGGGDGGSGGGSTQQCTFRHLLTLEMPATGEDSSGEHAWLRRRLA